MRQPPLCCCHDRPGLVPTSSRSSHDGRENSCVHGGVEALGCDNRLHVPAACMHCGAGDELSAEGGWGGPRTGTSKPSFLYRQAGRQTVRGTGAGGQRGSNTLRQEARRKGNRGAPLAIRQIWPSRLHRFCRIVDYRPSLMKMKSRSGVRQEAMRKGTRGAPLAIRPTRPRRLGRVPLALTRQRGRVRVALAPIRQSGASTTGADSPAEAGASAKWRRLAHEG